MSAAAEASAASFARPRQPLTEHHKSARLVLVLSGALPLLPRPLVVQEQVVVRVGERDGGEGPGLERCQCSPLQ